MRKRLIGYVTIWAVGLFLAGAVIRNPYIFCAAINVPVALGGLLISLIVISCAWRWYTKLLT